MNPDFIYATPNNGDSIENWLKYSTHFQDIHATDFVASLIILVCVFQWLHFPIHLYPYIVDNSLLV